MRFLACIVAIVTMGPAGAAGLWPYPREVYFSGEAGSASVVELRTWQDRRAGARSFQRSDVNCIKFASPNRLHEGTGFTVSLPGDLEFRLRANGAWGWSVSVGPNGDASVDFLWVVSPPFETAPHRSVGAAHGVSARESAQFERRFRFVLHHKDYQTALKIIETEPASEAKMARLNELGKGTVQSPRR